VIQEGMPIFRELIVSVFVRRNVRKNFFFLSQRPMLSTPTILAIPAASPFIASKYRRLMCN
jgi:hypothetical protein